MSATKSGAAYGVGNAAGAAGDSGCGGAKVGAAACGTLSDGSGKEAGARRDEREPVAPSSADGVTRASCWAGVGRNTFGAVVGSVVSRLGGTAAAGSIVGRAGVAAGASEGAGAEVGAGASVGAVVVDEGVDVGGVSVGAVTGAAAELGARFGPVVGDFSSAFAAVKNTFAAEAVISPPSRGRCDAAQVHAAIKLNKETQRRIVMPYPWCCNRRSGVVRASALRLLSLKEAAAPSVAGFDRRCGVISCAYRERGGNLVRLTGTA